MSEIPKYRPEDLLSPNSPEVAIARLRNSYEIIFNNSKAKRMHVNRGAQYSELIIPEEPFYDINYRFNGVLWQLTSRGFGWLRTVQNGKPMREGTVIEAALINREAGVYQFYRGVEIDKFSRYGDNYRQLIFAYNSPEAEDLINGTFREIP